MTLRVALSKTSSAPKVTLSSDGTRLQVLLGRVLDTDDIMHTADYERAEGVAWYHADTGASGTQSAQGEIAMFDAANVNRLTDASGWTQLTKVVTVVVSDRAYTTVSSETLEPAPTALTGHDDPDVLYIRDGVDPTAALATFTVTARGARDAAGFYKLTGTMTLTGTFPAPSGDGRLQVDFVREAHKTIDPHAIRDTTGLVRGDDADTPKGFVVIPSSGEELQWRTPAQAHDDVVGGAPDMSDILHGGDDGFVVSNDGSAGIIGMSWFRALICIMFGTQLTSRKKVVANNGITNTDDAFDVATVGGQRRLFIANGSDGSYVGHIGVGDIVAFWKSDFSVLEVGIVTGEHQWLNDRQINIDNVVAKGTFVNEQHYNFTLLSRQKLANAAL